jgi:hypothetical protein
MFTTIFPPPYVHHHMFNTIYPPSISQIPSLSFVQSPCIMPYSLDLYMITIQSHLASLPITSIRITLSPRLLALTDMQFSPMRKAHPSRGHSAIIALSIISKWNDPGFLSEVFRANPDGLGYGTSGSYAQWILDLERQLLRQHIIQGKRRLQLAKALKRRLPSSV